MVYFAVLFRVQTIRIVLNPSQVTPAEVPRFVPDRQKGAWQQGGEEANVRIGEGATRLTLWLPPKPVFAAAHPERCLMRYR